MSERSRSLGLASVEAYWNRLRSDPIEVTALVERVVVPETWFLREPEALKVLALETRQLPHHRDLRKEPLRILSAPCATGEEPLSIVMTLLELGWSPKSFQVVAADISEDNLTKASQGWYPPHSFRSRHLAFRDRFFTAASDGYQICQQVSAAVSWHRMDLVTQSILEQHEPFDFIFCRNLFIYLRSEARRQVLDHLVSALKVNGGLFVGTAECGYLSRQMVHCDRVEDAFVFRRLGTRPAAAQTPRMQTEGGDRSGGRREGTLGPEESSENGKQVT